MNSIVWSKLIHALCVEHHAYLTNLYLPYPAHIVQTNQHLARSSFLSGAQLLSVIDHLTPLLSSQNNANTLTYQEQYTMAPIVKVAVIQLYAKVAS
jgi:hypothetical protein